VSPGGGVPLVGHRKSYAAQVDVLPVFLFRAQGERRSKDFRGIITTNKKTNIPRGFTSQGGREIRIFGFCNNKLTKQKKEKKEFSGFITKIK